MLNRKIFMSLTEEYLWRFVASHTYTEGNSVEQYEV